MVVFGQCMAAFKDPSGQCTSGPEWTDDIRYHRVCDSVDALARCTAMFLCSTVKFRAQTTVFAPKTEKLGDWGSKYSPYPPNLPEVLPFTIRNPARFKRNTE